MAHLFHIPAYVDGKRAVSQTIYPQTEAFTGFNAPSRLEGEVFELEVYGGNPVGDRGHILPCSARSQISTHVRG
jgi:hypothetical protein